MENTNRASASITKTASFGRISVPDIVICGVKVPRNTESKYNSTVWLHIEFSPSHTRVTETEGIVTKPRACPRLVFPEVEVTRVRRGQIPM